MDSKLAINKFSTYPKMDKFR